MTNLTPPSASADNEQGELRATVHKRLMEISQSYAGYINSGVKELWPPMFGQIEDYAVSFIAHHTKEAVLEARIDELERLYDPNDGIMASHYIYLTDGAADEISKALRTRLAELAAPQQSTSPDGKASNKIKVMSSTDNCDINTTGYCEAHKQEGLSCMASKDTEAELTNPHQEKS